MERLSRPTAAQNFLSTNDYRRVMDELLEVTRSGIYYLQSCKLMELEILYNTTDDMNEVEKKEIVIEHLLNLGITNEKGNLVHDGVEKGKLIVWTLFNLWDPDYFYGINSNNLLLREKLVSSISKLLFIENHFPTSRDFNDVAAIFQRLKELINMNLDAQNIWMNLMEKANKHFKFGNFKKAVDSSPKTYNPSYCLTIQQKMYISELKEKLKIRIREIAIASKIAEAKIKTDLKAKKPDEVVIKEEGKRENFNTIFENEPEFFSHFKMLIKTPIYKVENSLWTSDLHNFLKKWENLRKDWKIETLFSEMFQYLKKEQMRENGKNLKLPFLRMFVEFLSIPILRYEEVSKRSHRCFQRLLLEASEKFPQQTKLTKEIRILYTSLGHNLKDDNNIPQNIRSSVFYKIPISVASFTSIKSELLKLPKDAYSYQRQKISELLYIYRKAPENILPKLLDILVTNETKLTTVAAILLLWVFVEIMDNRLRISSVELLGPLFRQSISTNWTHSIFKELVSIRQELAFKLPHYADFSKIDEIGSSYQNANWAAAISSISRKPGMYYYQNLTQIEESKIEIIQASLKQALSDEIQPKILENSDILENNNVSKMCPEITTQSKSRSNPTITQTKPILSSQEMEQIKQKMIGVCQTIPNSSNPFQLKMNKSNGECSSSWLTSIIPSKDSIVLNSNSATETKPDNKLVHSSEVHSSGKVFAEIKKQIIKSQNFLKCPSSTIVGDKMEVIQNDDFVTEEYVDQVLSPSFQEQRLQIVEGKVVIVITHSLKYDANKRKLN